jgi:peptidoglycan/LPS O-acetylase OafA/YrhL
MIGVARQTQSNQRLRRSVGLHPYGSLPKDIPALTGVRFFAAAWVVVFHFRDEFSQLLPAFDHLKPLVLQGSYAVPLFFILSGFILSHTYFPRYSLRGHGEFVFLRFARLWPVHLVAILVLIVYLILLKLHSRHVVGDNYSFAALPTELAMVRCWGSKALIWNYPAWSIHSEWFAYLFLFPIAFLCFHKASDSRVLLLIIIALLSLQSFLPLDEVPGKCMDIIFLFLAGSGLYRLRVLSPNVSGHLAAPVGLVVLAAGIGTHCVCSRMFIHTAFALLIFGLSFGRGLLSSILSTRLIVYGGAISYCIYMTHALVGKLYGTFAGNTVLRSPFLLIVALLTAAVAFHHLIEIPCNTALRRGMVAWGASGHSMLAKKSVAQQVSM